MSARRALDQMLCRDVVGRLVRLTADVQRKNGLTYPRGSEWLVAGTYRGTFTLEPPTRVDGAYSCIARINRHKFELSSEWKDKP